MVHIFINYRKGGGAYAAALLDALLSERFGEDQVFRAAKSVVAGTDFAESILKAVSECQVMLVVVDPDWSDKFNTLKSGSPDTFDWVQKEIEEAFRLNRIVVPVLLSGADRLRQDDLPVPLVRLAFLQYLRFDYRNVRQDSIYMAEQLARVSPSIGDRYVAQLRRPSGFRSFVLALGKGLGREQRADTLPTSHV
ncbi:toll/interleukin-1 receptor domain-containing protein [Streptomyces microflavus]|uniref:toll/interleukin-1 receptor domain-containing protein n=1 Tax=Streptomyces microflavus TaxID=1919 RepID=UPI0033F5A7F2